MTAPATIQGLATGNWRTTFRTKGRKYPIRIELKGDGKFTFHFSYNKNLIAVIKNQFSNRRYAPETKTWTAPINERNLFRIDFLTGNDPYKPWSRFTDHTSKLLAHCAVRKIEPLKHQVEMINLALAHRRVMLAAEMGLGKTLAALITCEILDLGEMWWVSTKGPLAAAKLEFRKWGTHLEPRCFTYRKAVTFLESYTGDPPRMLVIDESSCCKNATTQRTRAMMHVASAMREKWGDECCILLLTGTPAPKKPIDWFAQCEILQPGFITEGHTVALQDRLGLFDRDPERGWTKLITWFDDPDKCRECGEIASHVNHNTQGWTAEGGERQTAVAHHFVKSKNEVAAFGKRLKGLVGSWKKIDCLDLPPQQFHVEFLTPTAEIMNVAKGIVDNATRGADALIQLRTLSDGFIYKHVETGEQIHCDQCADGQVEIDDQGTLAPCGLCSGKGYKLKTERVLEEYPSPKIDYLKQLLQVHEEVGRFVTYAAFQGSIDLITRTCLLNGWQVFQADGRGWKWFNQMNSEEMISEEQMLYAFQEGDRSRVCFVGHARSAGMGLTLHRSPSTFFYSCDFDPQNRFQAAARGHRIGMREDGGHIYDVVHLPSDAKVIKSLKESKSLEDMTLAELKEFYS